MNINGLSSPLKNNNNQTEFLNYLGTLPYFILVAREGDIGNRVTIVFLWGILNKLQGFNSHREYVLHSRRFTTGGWLLLWSWKGSLRPLFLSCLTHQYSSWAFRRCAQASWVAAAPRRDRGQMAAVWPHNSTSLLSHPLASPPGTCQQWAACLTGILGSINKPWKADNWRFAEPAVFQWGRLLWKPEADHHVHIIDPFR